MTTDSRPGPGAVADAADEARRRRLLWRCRRGMKELDLLLHRFAAERYPAATPEQQRLFEDFIDLPDPRIADLLLGYAVAEDPRQADLVRAILGG